MYRRSTLVPLSRIETTRIISSGPTLVRIILRDGLNDYEILEHPDLRRPYASSERDTFPLDFRDSHSALSFLRRFLDKPSQMTALRKLLGSSSVSVHRFANHEVLRQIAEQVRIGQIRIMRTERRVRWRRLVTETAVEEVALPPRREPSTPVVSTPPPVEETLPPNSVDQDAQAAALIEAARDGVPFCEECEKARLAEEAIGKRAIGKEAIAGDGSNKRIISKEALVTHETISADALDQIAQADALMAAARQGVPFCDDAISARLPQETVPDARSYRRSRPRRI